MTMQSRIKCFAVDANQSVTSASPLSSLLSHREKQLFFTRTAPDSTMALQAHESWRALARCIVAANWIWNAIALVLGLAVGAVLSGFIGR